MLHSFDQAIIGAIPPINEVQHLYLEVIECLIASELGIYERETVVGIFKSKDKTETLLFTSSRMIICQDRYRVIVDNKGIGKLLIKKLWRDGILFKWIKLGDESIGISNENYEKFDTISTLIQQFNPNEFDIHDTQEQKMKKFFTDTLATQYSNAEIDEKEYHRRLTRIITVFPIESYYPKMKVQNSNEVVFVPHNLISVVKMSFVNLLRYHCIQNHLTIEEYESIMIEFDLPFRSIYKVKPLISCVQCSEMNPIGSLFCMACRGSLID